MRRHVRATRRASRPPRLPGRRAVVLAALAALSLTVAACGGSGGSSGSGGATGARAASDRSLTVVVPQDWGTLDPTASSGTPEGTLLLALEPLVLVEPDGSIAPNLATELPQRDPRTHVYKLRRGVKFWDGAPLTIGDVVYSLRMHVGPRSGSVLTRGYGDVTSVDAKGNDEVVVHLAHPSSQFDTILAQTGIVERRVREAHLKDIGSPGALNVGTGPYKWVSVKPGDEIVLARNPLYWGPKPRYARLNLRFIADDAARLLAMRSGDVDVNLSVPDSERRQYQSLPGFQLAEGPDPAVELLSMSTTKAPWSDVHVRRAASLAIDRAGLVQAILQGKGAVAPVLPDAPSLQRVMGPTRQQALFAKLSVAQDVAAAKAELAKSSVPHGFSGELVYDEAEADGGRVAQAIAQQLGAIGIRLTVKSMSDDAYTNAIFLQHTAAAAVVNFTTDSKDPASLPVYLTNSRYLGYLDLADYRSAANDAALNRAIALPTADKAGRAAALEQALTQEAADVPYATLYHGSALASVRDGLSFGGFDGQWWLTRWPDQISAR